MGHSVWTVWLIVLPPILSYHAAMEHMTPVYVFYALIHNLYYIYMSARETKKEFGGNENEITYYRSRRSWYISS